MRAIPGRGALLLMVGPALAVVAGLFGGGLWLGVMQALGYLPAAGMSKMGFSHFARILTDPDLLESLFLTFYISSVSTVAAVAVSVPAALLLHHWAGRSRIVHFLFQIPLTVPHLVVAVAMVFLLSPSGFLARIAVGAGLIEGAAGFPVMVNDRWGIGIMAAYVWKEIPFITLMILPVLRQSGDALTDVGRTLKAGTWQRFRYITLPTIFPSLGAASLIVFAYTFGAFEVPYLLGRTYPMMLPVQAYKYYSDVDLMARPEGIATAVVIALVVVLVFLASQWVTGWARSRGRMI